LHCSHIAWLTGIRAPHRTQPWSGSWAGIGVGAEVMAGSDPGAGRGASIGWVCPMVPRIADEAAERGRYSAVSKMRMSESPAA
jgi:hypothetical protein